LILYTYWDMLLYRLSNPRLLDSTPSCNKFWPPQVERQHSSLDMSTAAGTGQIEA